MKTPSCLSPLDKERLIRKLSDLVDYYYGGPFKPSMIKSAVYGTVYLTAISAIYFDCALKKVSNTIIRRSRVFSTLSRPAIKYITIFAILTILAFHDTVRVSLIKGLGSSLLRAMGTLISIYFIILFIVIASKQYYKSNGVLRRLEDEPQDSIIIKLFHGKNTYRIKFDTESIEDHYELHPAVKELLTPSIRDKYHFMISTIGGLENRPFLAAKSLRVADSDVIIKIRGASFADIWATHFSADIALARSIAKEAELRKPNNQSTSYNSPINGDHRDFISLRRVFQSYLYNKLNENLRPLMSCLENTPGTEFPNHCSYPDLILPTIFPNYIGISGFFTFVDSCSADEAYTLLYVRPKTSVDGFTLQSSYSGMIGIYDDLFKEVKEQGALQREQSLLTADLSVSSVVKDRILDKLPTSTFNEPPEMSVEYLGIMFSAEYLFQLELITLVSLTDCRQSAAFGQAILESGVAIHISKIINGSYIEDLSGRFIVLPVKNLQSSVKALSEKLPKYRVKVLPRYKLKYLVDLYQEYLLST